MSVSLSSDPPHLPELVPWSEAWRSGVAWWDDLQAAWVSQAHTLACRWATATEAAGRRAAEKEFGEAWAEHSREAERLWAEQGATADGQDAARRAGHQELAEAWAEVTQSLATNAEAGVLAWGEWWDLWLTHLLRSDLTGGASPKIETGLAGGGCSGSSPRWEAICRDLLRRQVREFFRAAGPVRGSDVGPPGAWVDAPELAHLVLEHCGAPIVVADARHPDYPVIAINSAFERMSGYGREDIVGRNCRLLQGSEVQPEAKAHIRRALSRGEPARVLLRNYRKDGSLYWNQLDLAPLRDERGEVTHYIGVQNDVTRLKQLEVSESDVARRWEALFSTMPVGVVLLDLESGCFIFVNDHLSATLNYAPGELVGKRPVDIHRPEDFPEVHEELQRLIRGETTIVLNQPFMRRDGSQCYCDVHAVRIHYGGLDCLCGIMLDNSERRAMEADLQHTLQRLNAVMRANPDIMLVFDRECLIVDCLPRDDARFFRPLAEFLQRPVEAVMPPAVATLARKSVAQVLADGQVLQVNYDLFGPEETRYYEARFSPYLEQQVLAVVRDVTGLRLAERSLASSLAEFVALFETMTQGVVYQDEIGQIVRVNSAACDLLGLTPDQLAGRTSVDPAWQALREDGSPLPGDEHPAMVSLRTGRPVENVVMGIARPDRAERVWLLVSARPEFKAGERRAYRVFTSFTDMTQRRHIEEDLQRQSRIQELLLGIGAVFINLPAEQVEPAIQQALADLGRYFEADRMFIFSADQALTVVSNTHEWCAPGVSPQIDNLQDVPVDGLGTWMGNFRRGENYELENVLALPPDSPERQVLEPQGITSLITAPLMDRGHCRGFLGLDFVGRHRKTSKAEQRLLRVFAQSLVNVWDRLTVQRELTESRSFLADIIENGGGLIFVKDKAGRYCIVNRRWEETAGCSREWALGRDDDAVFPPELAARFRRQDVEVMRTEQLQQFEEVIAAPSGSRYYLTVKFPTRDADGGVSGVAGMSTDITALKRNEMLEQKRGEVLQSLLASDPLGVIFLRLVEFVENGVPDSRCSILTINPDDNTLEVACAPNLPADYNAAVHGVPVRVGIGSCGTAAATGEPCFTENIQNDPHWTPAFREHAARAGLAACWSSPIKSSFGRVLGTFALYRSEPSLPDGEQLLYLSQAAALTALTIDQDSAREDRRARQEAETLAGTHQRFLARMSHEIRTPLNSIIGFSHSLLSRTPLGENEQRQVGAIASSGEHLLMLINDILDFSKIEAGRVTLELVDFSPEQFFSEVVDVFRPRVEEKRLAFAFTAPAAWPPGLQCDVLKLRQILNNLLGNALKFTSQGRLSLTVTLEPATSARTRWLEVTVADTGPGIPAEELPWVFDDFYQGGQGRKVGGTGLGLAISRRLVRCMNGEITVISAAGKGASFCCRLPLASAEVAGESTSSEVEATVEMVVSASVLDLTPARVAAGLSVAHRRQLADTVAQGKMRDFRNLLTSLPVVDSALADELNELAAKYDYDSLRRLLVATSPPDS